MKIKLFNSIIIPISYGILMINAFNNASKADIGSINLRINATIVSNTCTVNLSSKNQTIDLGVWASRQFFSGINPVTTPVPFTILLENCGPAAREVKLFFDGNTDSQNNELFALNSNSTAENVGIAILDKNNQRITPKSYSIPHVITNEVQIPLQFYAQYVATGNSVQPGSANTEVTFEMTYE
ncbi:fimbrial protein [Providencia sp. Je.9.19]|uniref:fimbrial protein n=1 Tax=Providencia sp. Je.9.19 TaxID=3142844 RepID=UPI003DAA06BB